MLHIINKSPFAADSLRVCLELVQPKDAILFIEEGVLATLAQSEFAEVIQVNQKKLEFFALQADLEARGLLQKVLTGIQLVDYQGFVDLAIQYHPIQSWS